MKHIETIELALEALSSIDIYLSDTLSGRVNPEPATYKQWLIDGIIEARNRSRAAITATQQALADIKQDLTPVQQDQVCPQKICWTPYECENGRCTGLEKNEPIGRFNGNFCAGDGKMVFEVEVDHDKALPSIFSLIYTTPPAAQLAKQCPPCNHNCNQGDTCPARK
jgi:hypothetical protein